MPEPPHQVRYPILSPPRPASVHEVASASESGRRLRRNYDAVGVIGLSLPQEDLDLVVLAVADGLGEHARGTEASSVAVESFGDALGGMMGSLLLGKRWQFGLAELVEAAMADTNARIRALPPTSRGEPAATTLTAAILMGDWLCAVHVGNSRVYRLADNELEQLTEDHAREPEALLTPPREDMLTINDTGRLASALGVTDVVTPSVLFRRIAPGDVVAVCSDGLHEAVGGEELARLLNAPGSLEDIAKNLVAAAYAHGGEDNVSVCLARVGPLTTRLPEPDERVERLYGDVAATILPRYQAETAREWLPDRVGLVAGFLVSLALLAGFVLWDGYKTSRAARAGGASEERAVKAGRVGAADSGWTSTAAAPPAVGQTVTPPPAAVPVEVASVPDTTPRESAAALKPEARVPAPEVPTPKAPPAKAPPAKAPPAKVPAAVIADSIAAANALKREAALARVRQVRDSVADAQLALEERQRRDSVALAVAAATRAAEQRVRDSAAAAEKHRRDSIEAQERLEAQARAAQQAEEARQAQERQRETRITTGKAALNSWLRRLVAAVSSGESRAAVLAAGPPNFPEFVEKNSPKISDASITSLEVDEASGEATAVWQLKWRSNFGTATQRRMKASATVVRDGENWRLLGWKILEGGP